MEITKNPFDSVNRQSHTTLSFTSSDSHTHWNILLKKKRRKKNHCDRERGLPHHSFGHDSERRHVSMALTKTHNRRSHSRGSKTWITISFPQCSSSHNLTEKKKKRERHKIWRPRGCTHPALTEAKPVLLNNPWKGNQNGKRHQKGFSPCKTPAVYFLFSK